MQLWGESPAELTKKYVMDETKDCTGPLTLFSDLFTPRRTIRRYNDIW